MAITDNCLHYIQCGLGNVFLQNGYSIESSPYGEGVSIHDVDSLHKAISRTIIDKPTPLRGDEFRFLRVELDLSQKALGEYLGKTDQSVANWEKTGNIPREVDFLMRHIFRQTMNEASLYVEEVDRLRSMDQSDYDEWLSFQESHGRWEQALKDCV
jgi:putative transcriptional regulator